MHANGKRVKVEMGTLDGRGDNTKPWFGHIHSSCGLTKKYVIWVEGSWPKSKRSIDKRYVKLDTSSAAEVLAPRSRAKATAAAINRVKKKLDMDQEATLRAKDKEIAYAFLGGGELGLLGRGGINGEGRVYRHCRFGEDRAYWERGPGLRTLHDPPPLPPPPPLHEQGRK